jgi:transglutaminase-like putative cysteine protease
LLSDTFARVLWQVPVDFRGYDSEEEQMYFLFKRHAGRAKILQQLCLDTAEVEFAPCETGVCEFGGMSGQIDGYYAFRTPVYNLKIDSNQRFDCNLKSHPFSFSFKELVKEVDSNLAYGFPAFMDLSAYVGSGVVSANVGAFVSKGQTDPLLRKLAEEITRGANTAEEKYQKVLAFVSEQIAYSFEDYWYDSEITKRAHEVLFSGEADCSGKSTLMASMLEALNLPYCLLYFDKHMNIGVPGNFKADNAYHQDIEGTRYFMAETTVPGFIIGQSLLANHEILDKVLFYQIPSKGESVINPEDNRKVPLLNIENME